MKRYLWSNKADKKGKKNTKPFPNLPKTGVERKIFLKSKVNQQSDVVMCYAKIFLSLLKNSFENFSQNLTFVHASKIVEYLHAMNLSF